MDIITSNYTEVAEGQTGTVVAGIINTIQEQVYGTVQYDFTQDDVSNYMIEQNHGKGTRKMHVTLFDNDWVKQTTDGLFTADDANNWSLAVNNEITGTWHLIVTYLP